MAGWSELPEDILLLILKQLHSLVCFVLFGAVCRSWRSAAMKNPHEFLLSQPPWLMLSCGNSEKEDNNRLYIAPYSFVSLAEPKKRVYKVEIPGLHKKRCIGSMGTCLITVDKEDSISLTNPFSRDEVLLPSKPGLSDYVYLLQKVVLSSSTTNPKAVVAMGISCSNSLVFARPGDGAWTPLMCLTHRTSPPLFDDIVFYEGKFYAVNQLGEVFVCDIDGPHPPKATIIVFDCWVKSRQRLHRCTHHCNSQFYLVEVLGELMLVLRLVIYYYDKVSKLYIHETIKFDVFKLDFPSRKWVAVKNLGCHSLFLGMNTSVSVLVSDSSVLRSNCIYFTDDDCSLIWGNRCLDMGVFNLENGRMSPYYTGSSSVLSPPIWIVPRSIT